MISIIRKREKKDSKQLLRKELQRLAICEFIAIPNFWCVYMLLWILCVKEGINFVNTPIIVYPLSLLSFILVQGSIYWYICLRRIDGKNVPKKNALIYSKLKVVNLFLILLYIPIFFKFNASTNNIMIGMFIYIFSILEYINYFFIRLSYKNPLHFFANLKRFKFPKSQIVKEIEKYQK